MVMGFVGMTNLYSDVSGMDINDNQSTTCCPFQAGQLSTHKTDDLVQLCGALLTILGQALEALCRDCFPDLLGPIHLCNTHRQHL